VASERRKAALTRSAVPETTRAESDFDRLQARFPQRAEYGYDPRSTWRRAAGRATEMIQSGALATPGARVLDVGAGDGMLGVLLESFGHSVQLADQEDWRDSRARGLPLTLGDCCDRLPLAMGAFDVACSFNSFEHLPDPKAALREMIRVTRPGGEIHIDFGPLYNGPWGLHAYRSLRMPYPQFLFSAEFVAKKLKEIGIWDLGKKRDTLQYLNQWSLAQFDELWRNSGCQIRSRRIQNDPAGLELLDEYPAAFQGRGLSLDEVLATGITVILTTPQAS
jgi:SAM-dependent methyltransferase